MKRSRPLRAFQAKNPLPGGGCQRIDREKSVKGFYTVPVKEGSASRGKEVDSAQAEVGS